MLTALMSLALIALVAVSGIVYSKTMDELTSLSSKSAAAASQR